MNPKYETLIKDTMYQLASCQYAVSMGYYVNSDISVTVPEWMGTELRINDVAKMLKFLGFKRIDGPFYPESMMMIKDSTYAFLAYTPSHRIIDITFSEKKENL